MYFLIIDHDLLKKYNEIKSAILYRKNLIANPLIAKLSEN